MWENAQTDHRLKKRIVCTLIQEIVADVDAEAGEVILIVHWQGGVHTELRLPRRRRGQNARHTAKPIIDAVRVLARIGADDRIAGTLNRNGLRTGHDHRWTRERVISLRSAHRIPGYQAETRMAEGWMNLTEAARFLGISARTLRLAVERGDIEAEHPLAEGPWVFNQRALTTEAAVRLVQHAQRRGGNPAVPNPNHLSIEFSST